MKKFALILIFILFSSMPGFSIETITFYPLEHTTVVIQSSQRTIFVDPDHYLSCLK